MEDASLSEQVTEKQVSHEDNNAEWEYTTEWQDKSTRYGEDYK
jgi:hypothetical protein